MTYGFAVLGISDPVTYQNHDAYKYHVSEKVARNAETRRATLQRAAVGKHCVEILVLPGHEASLARTEVEVKEERKTRASE